jgi:hypothetical protein
MKENANLGKLTATVELQLAFYECENLFVCDTEVIGCRVLRSLAGFDEFTPSSGCYPAGEVQPEENILLMYVT